MFNIKSQADYDLRYPTVPLERWINNVVEAARDIGDTDYQARNWFREDRPAWEHPNEMICVLFDDSVFDDFLTDCAFSFSDRQQQSAQIFSTTINRFLNETPQNLDPHGTFHDPRWEEVRITARAFVAAFSGT
jgi:hypothetical protein